jgi:hypothetical protein
MNDMELLKLADKIISRIDLLKNQVALGLSELELR